MIFVANLAVVAKRALGDACFQTTIEKIIDTLPMDSKVSNMEAVILGARDATGTIGVRLNSALQKAHPSVCVIYLYQKDKDKDLVQCQYKKLVKKITPEVITDVHAEFLGDHITKMKASDFSSDNTVITSEPEPEELPDLPMDEIPKVEVPPLDLPPLPVPTPAPEPTPEPPISSMEESIKNITNFKDWNLFKKQLDKDMIAKKLLEENTEYQGLLQMLDVLDQQIATIWRDSALTQEEKFNRIREVGRQRAGLRGQSNSICVNKVISLIESVCMAAKRTVDEKVNSLSDALQQIKVSRNDISNVDKINKAIFERTEIHVELMNMKKAVIELYTSMDTLAKTSIQDLDDKLPSNNPLVNTLVKPIGDAAFIPDNTIVLTNKLMEGLQDGWIKMSQLEQSVDSIISLIYKLLDKDNDIIQYQQNLINLLIANRVEDLVLVDNLLKNVFRIYTGADGTGRSATAIIHSGILSRRHNVLLLDLTGRDKFAEYGIESVSLNEFLLSQIEKNFACVRSRKLNAEEVQELITKLKTLVSYYAYINVIVAPEDIDVLNQLCAEAFVVHYVTDCTKTSLDRVKSLISNTEVVNIAKKLVMVAPPIDPLDIAVEVGADLTSTKIVPIPYMPEVRAACLKKEEPFLSDTVRIAFEEAFV